MHSALDSRVLTRFLMGFRQGQTADVTHALTASLSAEMRHRFAQSFCALGLQVPSVFRLGIRLRCSAQLLVHGAVPNADNKQQADSFCFSV